MRLPAINLPRPLAVALCFLPLIPELLLPGLGALFLFGTCALALLLSADARRATLRWHDGSAGREALIGLGAGIVISLFQLFLLDPLTSSALGEHTNLDNFANVRGNLANALVLLVIAWVVGGAFEEISHRGFVIGWGSRLLGERATVPLLLISSAVFGAAHLYQGKVGAVSAGVTGLLLGILYLFRNKTLVAPMIAHGIIDTIGIAAIYLNLDLA